MNELNVPRFPALIPFLKRCVTPMKMIGVTLLILLLLIPLQMIRSILKERLSRRNEAVSEIMSSWGREQSMIGPVLIVPYQYSVKSWKEQPAGAGKTERIEVEETAVANAYFLPSTLSIQGTITPSRLHRGIYEAVVYSGKLGLSGQFARPDFKSLRIEEKDVLWEEALVTFAIPDLRGVKGILELEWGENRVALSPGCRLPGFSSGVFAKVNGLRTSAVAIPIRMEVALNGSGGIHFSPVGAQNTVRLTSPWPNPSFCGAFLPEDRKVSKDGFEATWQISYYGRDFAQQWTDRQASTGVNPSSASNSFFGVNFLTGIDAYRNVERAIKYGVLFLALVFTAFFLFEILSSLKIHLFQYALVGAALSLFYLGLLSLSEFISFGLAYLAVAVVTMLLIGYYCVKALQSGRRTMILMGLLSAIYGFLYVALQLQDFSLLFGTAGLFVALAIVIGVTRNIDWYQRDQA
ncbi:MAG TPA: cell envelope integrity protein CreD [Candidatus Paceibacterota bacterium]|nr:cell envelope integrity protein CreD [Verrucomicrobiota bacterium]HRY48119.1 cell envelope integrity protein CreD [Candidatus Paceibacterota bacterium]HSA00171.1 cell envelope integrity protein CreD [Candidatus Paceibacterota bacterium]